MFAALRRLKTSARQGHQIRKSARCHKRQFKDRAFRRTLTDASTIRSRRRRQSGSPLIEADRARGPFCNIQERMGLDRHALPTPALPLQSHNQGLELERQLVGLAIGAARAIRQQIRPVVATSSQQFVVFFARYVVGTVNRRQPVAVKQSGKEPKSFIHKAKLLSWHRAILHKGPDV